VDLHLATSGDVNRATSGDYRSAIDTGSDAFLDKPFHLEDFEDLVRRWLAR